MKDDLIRNKGMDMAVRGCTDTSSMIILFKELNEEMKALSKQIVSYKGGALTNLDMDDIARWEELERAFPEAKEVILDYTHLLHKLIKRDAMTEDLLPLSPFTVYPMYPPLSVGYRAGAGKEYMDCWKGVIMTLPKEKKEEYCSRFNYPSSWMSVFPCGKLPVKSAPFADMPWENANKMPEVCICTPGPDCPLAQN